MFVLLWVKILLHFFQTFLDIGQAPTKDGPKAEVQVGLKKVTVIGDSSYAICDGYRMLPDRKQTL